MSHTIPQSALSRQSGRPPVLAFSLVAPASCRLFASAGCTAGLRPAFLPFPPRKLSSRAQSRDLHLVLKLKFPISNGSVDIPLPQGSTLATAHLECGGSPPLSQAPACRARLDSANASRPCLGLRHLRTDINKAISNSSLSAFNSTGVPACPDAGKACAHVPHLVIHHCLASPPTLFFRMTASAFHSPSVAQALLPVRLSFAHSSQIPTQPRNRMLCRVPHSSAPLRRVGGFGFGAPSAFPF